MQLYKTISTIIVSFIIGTPILSQDLNDSLNLKVVLATALENNFSIRINNNNMEINKTNNTLGNAGFLPTIGVQSSYSSAHKDVEQKFFNSDEIRTIEDGKRDVFDLRGGLNWTLFDGMGMFVSKQQLNEFEQMGEFTAKIAIDNIVASVSDLHYSIVVEESKLKVLEEVLDVSDQRKKIVKDKYDAGRASYQEHLAAQVDYNADKSLLIRQENLVKQQKITLLNMLAVEADLNVSYNTNDSLKVLELINLQDVIMRSSLNNPSLLVAQREQNIAYLGIKKVQAEQFPALNFAADYGYMYSDASYGNLSLSKEFGLSYAFTLSWNIYDGSNVKRRKKVAQIEHENSLLAMQERELQLKNEIILAYQNYQNNLILVDLESDNRKIAEQNAIIALDRYKVGRSDFIEFRQMQTNYAEASNRYLDALYTVKLNENELLRLSGDITKTLLMLDN